MAKQRSPNYPAIGLPDAVTAVERFWSKEKRTPVSPATAAKAIGYESLSGPTRAKLSALKKYGLLEEVAGKLQISDLAVRILHGQEPARSSALRTAAESVELFRRLSESHADASEDALRSHLIVEEGFSSDGAKKFIEAFLATKEFAKLGTSPTMEGAGNETGDDEPILTTTQEKGAHKLSPTPQMASGSRQDVFSLEEGAVVLQWPARLSAASYEDFEGWLRIVLRKVKRSVAGSESATPPE